MKPIIAAIIAQIKAKYPGVNLSKARLNAIAAKIEEKVIDDETKIDAALTTYNDFNPLSEIAKHDDQVRNLEAKVKANPKKDDKPVDDKPLEIPVDDDTPAWAKALVEQNKKLAEGLTALQSEKLQTTIRSKVEQALSEKGKEVPVSYWGKRALPATDEEIEAFVTDVQTDYTGFKKDMTEQGISILPTPKSGEAADTTKNTAVSADIKAFVEKNKAPEPAKAN